MQYRTKVYHSNLGPATLQVEFLVESILQAFERCSVFEKSF